ncbi:unnamed protein product [Lathyrus oleraceus]
MSRDRESSPPLRHEKLKRARQRTNEYYNPDASRLVAEKIDSLVNSAREGSLVSEPRHDILVEAVGTKERGVRVRLDMASA